MSLAKGDGIKHANSHFLLFDTQATLIVDIVPFAFVLSYELIVIVHTKNGRNRSFRVYGCSAARTSFDST